MSLHFVALSVGNIFRRVLKIVRDEYKSIPEDTSNPGKGPSPMQCQYSPTSHTDSSMFNLLANPNRGSSDTVYYDRSKYELKPLIIQSVNELIDDLENTRKQIESHALENIQNEYVLVFVGPFLS